MAITITQNVPIITSASLGAGLTTTGVFDLTAKYGGRIQVKTNGDIAVDPTTSGIQVDVLTNVKTANEFSTQPYISFVVPVTLDVDVSKGLDLSQSGDYQIKLTNLDNTNAVTVEVFGETLNTV